VKSQLESEIDCYVIIIAEESDLSDQDFESDSSFIAWRKTKGLLRT